MAFLRAYLMAAAAAWAILAMIVAGSGVIYGGFPLLMNPTLILVVAIPYVLGYALAACAVGLGVLRLFTWTRLPYYVGLGGVLGALPAVTFLDGAGPLEAAVGMIMGAAAAAAFWFARRPARPSAPRHSRG
ncbi:MAG TPA: hypothetical protein VEW03_14855 [Longimicrobiaceae bacterium]|nr:hypothetical protein [Longimicrobiaceae bacterium]